MPCNFKVLQALNFWPSKNLQRFPFTAQKKFKVVLDAVTIKGCGVFSFGSKFILHLDLVIFQSANTCNFKVLQALNFWPSKNLQRFKVVLDAVIISVGL
jgi:hypothetical protein